MVSGNRGYMFDREEEAVLERVISGGQTGVDQAALAAAKLAGLETGGWAPKDWQTAAGPDFRLRDEWGLREYRAPGYRERTWANVQDADATLRLAVDFTTVGERCTMNAIRRYSKLALDVPLLEAGEKPLDWQELVLDWLAANGVQTLNVAGNREGTRGLHIYDLAVIFLLPVFLKAKGTRQ